MVVELPDDYPAIPEAYRVFLQRTGATQAEVRIYEFADRVRQLRPQWLVDLQSAGEEALAPVEGTLEDLAELAKSLGLAADAEGRAALPFKMITLRDEKDLRDRWLLGRAAIYYAEASLLAINVKYPPLEKLVAKLQLEFGSLGAYGPSQDAIRTLVESRFAARLWTDAAVCAGEGVRALGMELKAYLLRVKRGGLDLGRR